jgi:hypothetical protein
MSAHVSAAFVLSGNPHITFRWETVILRFILGGKAKIGMTVLLTKI